MPALGGVQHPATTAHHRDGRGEGSAEPGGALANVTAQVHGTSYHCNFSHHLCQEMRPLLTAS